MQNNGNDFPASLNLAFAEELYKEYLRDVNSVSTEWRTYFDRILADDDRHSGTAAGPTFRPTSIFNPPVEPSREGATVPAARGSDTYLDRVERLIRGFRLRGHMAAHVDPLSQPRVKPPEIEPSFFGFTEADLDRKFPGRMIYHTGELTLREIVEKLRNTYCRSIGMQFMHIDNYSARQWLQQRMESTQNRLQLTREEQIRILTRLTDAVTFEEFIRKKFIGAKSFSLEGAESLIPLLDLAIEKSGEDGVDEIVLGMAHRGRLNVLANIMGKPAAEIFREFEDKDSDLFSGGDVKYHLGYSHDWVTTAGKKIHLSLCFNPSHLEFVNPVVLGRIRAKQDRHTDARRERGMPILIHGDAAFIGEGIVQETLNLSQLPGYAVGGALHVIVNNQIGFTTSSSEGRSTMYASSVAKMLGSPIFHVNGEDPEAVAQCVRLAMDFRRSFKRDVIIDMYCYRRLGHNESDEPSFTQPVLYRAIEKHKPVREGYLEHLLRLGGVTRTDADEILKHRQEVLETHLSQARSQQQIQPPDSLRGSWDGYRGGPEPETDTTVTAIPKEKLALFLEAQTKLPQDFHPNPKIQKLIETRREIAAGRQRVDWAAAESLAFASLAMDGHRIRLTGQDCERGTFSHRHAVFHDVEDGHRHMPLQYLSKNQAPVEIYNSPLSEAGVLGFEYGYSLDCPEGLVLWEAQFGDFVNATQVIIDQFLVSAETKWRRLSGLVLLLPHGFEGMGPEHSSARLERFLQLAACDNIRVVYPTTPAQYFHLLRRQVVNPWRKPLVVMTPKSMLRLPASTSSLDELATGHFQRAIPDPEVKPDKVKRVLLCSGKVYFDLVERRLKLKRDDVAIIRLEQLYPFPSGLLKSTLAQYGDKTQVVWVQDAPENMGAWHYLRVQFCDKFLGKYPFAGISRPASPSPATGSASAHQKEQQKLLAAAFNTD